MSKALDEAASVAPSIETAAPGALVPPMDELPDAAAAADADGAEPAEAARATDWA